MSGILVLRLLGSPEIELDHAPVTGFMSQKVQAILFYLAMVGQTQSRVKLAALFWPDEPESKARKNVRDVAQNLRKLLPEHIEVTRSTMGMMPSTSWQVDALGLEMAVTNSPIDPEQLAAATTAYRDDFLDGFSIKDASEFDSWVISQTVRLRELQLQGLQWLSEYALNRRDIQAGLRLTRQSLMLEPWQEQVYKQRMLLYAYGQQPDMALQTYAACEQMLAEAFGTKPRMETEALYQRLLAEAGELETSTPLHNLPRQLTTFFGRAGDAHIVREKVLDERYPLLTITGEGGIGKTRLALTVAEQSLYDFKDGVWFVPLTGIRTGLEQAEAEEAVATAVATVLDINLSAAPSAKVQVVAHIKPLSLVLFFDNFEHLLNARGFIYTLLQEAKKVQLLITSRARLRFQAEFVYRLSGLPIPAEETPVVEMPDFAGIALFIERAKRIAPFTFSNDIAPCIQKICALVDGLPLGIELAAALVEEHSCLEISQKMQPDELETTFFDVPARHRSIQALFDYSWQLLPENAQQVLAQCSQFAGGFTLEAAQVVAWATPRSLELLVHQSLLHEVENASTEPSRSGRYDIHPLVQQFAYKKLSDLTQPQHQLEAVSQRHRRYYLQTSHATYAEIWCTSLAANQAEINNKQQAWQNALQTHDFTLLADAAAGWIWFLERVSLIAEAEIGLAEAQNLIRIQATDLPEQSEWLALLEIRRARVFIYTGYYQKAYDTAAKVLTLTQTASLLGLAYSQQCRAMWSTGFIEKADKLLSHALVFKEDMAVQDCFNLLVSQATVAALQGKEDEELTFLEESLRLLDQYPYPYEEVFVFHNLGVTYQYRGQRYKALAYYQRSCQTADKAEFMRGKVYALTNLAPTYTQLGMYKEANLTLQEAFQLGARLGDKHVLAELFVFRAFLNNATHRYGEALEDSQLAFTEFEQLESHLSLVLAYRAWGDAWLGQKEWEHAKSVYMKLVAHCETLSLPEGLVEPLSALAFIAYQQEDKALMSEHVDQVLALLPTISFSHESIGSIMDVYWRCYVVLDHLGDERAAGILETAVSQLQAQADQISDVQVRKQFLENIPSHRKLIQMRAN